MKPIIKYIIIAGVLTLAGVGIYILYGFDLINLEKNRIMGYAASSSNETVNVTCSPYEKESKCKIVGDGEEFTIKVPSGKKYREGDIIYFKYKNGKAKYCYIQNMDNFIMALIILLATLPFISLLLYGFEYGITKNKKAGFIGMIIFDIAILLSFISDDNFILITQIVLMAITFLFPLVYSIVTRKKDVNE